MDYDKLVGEAQGGRGGPWDTLASLGRGGDNRVVHASDKDLFIPYEALERRKDLRKGIRKLLREAGLKADRWEVGNKANQINPTTGLPEFAEDSSGGAGEGFGGGSGYSGGSDFAGDQSGFGMYDVTPGAGAAASSGMNAPNVAAPAGGGGGSILGFGWDLATKGLDKAVQGNVPGILGAVNPAVGIGLLANAGMTALFGDPTSVPTGTNDLTPHQGSDTSMGTDPTSQQVLADLGLPAAAPAPGTPAVPDPGAGGTPGGGGAGGTPAPRLPSSAPPFQMPVARAQGPAPYYSIPLKY